MDFPDTLKEFGYEFDEDGRLRDIETGNPFEFEVKEDDHAYNQSRYEALGELITPVVYDLLEKRCGLHRRPVPVDAAEDEPHSFVFCSDGFDEAEKLMVLIHGSGVVRAGQWARRLIINDSLNSGTQIPFIERGKKEGYGILVMNTNHNFDRGENGRTDIRGSEDPESHGKYVWEHYIRSAKAEKIAIVAHSFGGVVTVRLFEAFKKEFVARVFAVAMTDSIHFQSSDLTELRRIGQNWVTSRLDLDTPIQRRGKDVPCVSAGCSKHEMTSWSSFESIFKFFYRKLLPVEELKRSCCSLPIIPVIPRCFRTHAISSSDEEESMDDTTPVKRKIDGGGKEKEQNGGLESQEVAESLVKGKEKEKTEGLENQKVTESPLEGKEKGKIGGLESQEVAESLVKEKEEGKTEGLESRKVAESPAKGKEKGKLGGLESQKVVSSPAKKKVKMDGLESEKVVESPAEEKEKRKLSLESQVFESPAEGKEKENIDGLESQKVFESPAEGKEKENIDGLESQKVAESPAEWKEKGKTERLESQKEYESPAEGKEKEKTKRLESQKEYESPAEWKEKGKTDGSESRKVTKSSSGEKEEPGGSESQEVAMKTMEEPVVKTLQDETDKEPEKMELSEHEETLGNVWSPEKNATGTKKTEEEEYGDIEQCLKKLKCDKSF